MSTGRGRGSPTPDRRAELTKEQWIDVLEQLQNPGVAYIGFSGGEPLLRDDIEELIASVDDRGTTLMFTNGCGYTPRRARAIQRAGLFYSAVSFRSARRIRPRSAEPATCGPLWATSSRRRKTASGPSRASIGLPDDRRRV